MLREEFDAGEELARELAKVLPIKTVFWLKAKDEENPFIYLYFALDSNDDVSISNGYRAVTQATMRIPSPFLDPFRVKMILADDPLAREAIEWQQRFPTTKATRLRGQLFGGLFVDRVHLYPPLLDQTQLAAVESKS